MSMDNVNQEKYVDQLVSNIGINPVTGLLNPVVSSSQILFANAATGVAATDGVHIQALIDQVTAAEGGTVYLRENEVYVGNVTLKPKVLLRIPPSTTLRGSTSAPVVDGLNFATLTGKVKATGDYLLGAYGAGVIGGGTVDGNNVSTRCIRLWGTDLSLDVRTIKSAGHGIETEFTSVDSFADEAQRLEGSYGVIRSHGNAGDGWLNKGPHDSICRAYYCWDNTGWGYTVDTVAAGTGYNGGCTFDYFNSFLNTSGSVRVLGGGDVDIKSGALSGEGGIGLDLSSVSGSNRVRAAVAGHATGVKLRGTSHKIEITAATDQGYMGGNGDVVELDGAGWCEVDIGGGANNKNVFRFTSESGPNYLHGAVNIGATQTFKIGTPGSATTVLFSASGAAGALSEVRMPSARLYNPAGYSVLLPNSDGGTLAAGNVQGLTYGASIAVDASLAMFFQIGVSDANAFTIANPTNDKKLPITFCIQNNTAGAMGAITWAGDYRLAGAFVNPAAGKARMITFINAFGFWVEVSRSAADA